MLHNEARKLLIEAWNKNHNAKEIAECFSVNTSTVYRPEKRMRETGSVETRPSPHRCKTVSSQNDIQNINQLIQQQTDIIVIDNVRSHHAKMVKQILDKSGIRYMYLPPYSPDLNPIEKCGRN